MVHEGMRRRLIEIAQMRGLIFYSELAETFFIHFENEGDRNRLFRELGEISSEELAADRPMLSAVVVHKPTSSNPRMPGDGFFKLARDLGVWDGLMKKDAFFAAELNKVYDFWAPR